MKKTGELDIRGTLVRVVKINGEDYVSLTDMAKLKSEDAQQTISNWMRNRMTLEYLGLWEELYNPDFKPLGFEGFRKEVGLNHFTMSPSKWIDGVNAIGIVAQSGRYGGTYARSDIAFKFAGWISVEFELYMVKEFQRLKEQETEQLGWNAKRELAKINYHIHTSSVGKHLLPRPISSLQAKTVFASEADVLNVALFGMTAKEWRDSNPALSGNIRDYASINALICLSNMENINSVLIEEGLSQSERVIKLNDIAIRQMGILSKLANNDIIK